MILDAKLRDFRSLDRVGLIELVVLLIAELRLQRARVRSLRRQLEDARAQKGHAPFSKGRKKGKHKKTGRRPGRGPFSRRKPPDPSTVTKKVDIPVPSVCPHCGSAELEVDEKRQPFSTTDLPEKPSIEVIAGERPTGRCRHCGKRWRASCPEVPDDQYGATAHRLGPRVLGEAMRLHYEVGVPLRQVPSVLESHGIQVTQGALTQAALRIAESGPLADRAEQIERQLPQEPIIHVDATGWRIAGEGAALTTFATPDSAQTPGKTVYKITKHHGADEVLAVIGSDFQGVLGTDRGGEYRSKKLARVRFQKCNGHIKQNVKEVLEDKTNAARDFGETLCKLLDEARQLHRDYHAGHREGFEEKVAKLEARVTEHLRDRKFRDPDNQRLLDGIGAEHDAGNLLRFLHDPRLSPDNFLAERQLRPPIKARKVSHCSKNERGAIARARHMTVIQTERRTIRFEEVEAKKVLAQTAEQGPGQPSQKPAAQLHADTPAQPQSPRRPTLLDRITCFFQKPHSSTERSSGPPG